MAAPRDDDLLQVLLETGRPLDVVVPLTSVRQVKTVTAQEFGAVEEAGAEPLLGPDADNAVLARGGDAMLYGDGGAGKTTLLLDLGCHLAAGDDWLGVVVPAPVSVLVVELEGPRQMFRRKVARKLAGWGGSPLDDRLWVWEEPWARFTFGEEPWRAALAEEVQKRNADVVMVGPLTAAGMETAGTLQDVRRFAALMDEVPEVVRSRHGLPDRASREPWRARVGRLGGRRRNLVAPARPRPRQSAAVLPEDALVNRLPPDRAHAAVGSR